MACRWIRSVFCFAMMASSCPAAVTVEAAYAWAGGARNLEYYDGNAPVWATLQSISTVPTGSGDNEYLNIAAAVGSATWGWRSWPIDTPNETTYTHIGFWISINNPDLVIITAAEFFRFGPGGSRDIGLKLSSTGGGTDHVLHILRASGSVVSISQDVFEDDVWYWLDLYYKISDTVGRALLYLTPDGDDTRNLLVATSAAIDFKDGGVLDHQFRLDSQRGPAVPFGGSSNFRFKNLIIEYGITSTSSEGTFRVASLVSNPYKTGVVSDVGDDIVGGDWDDVSDSVSATHADFETATTGGIVTDDATSPGIIGPKDQFGTGVIVLGAKWAIHAHNTGTPGLGGVFYGKYDGSSYTTGKRIHSTCGDLCNVSYFEAAGGSYIPDIADEWFIVGGANDDISARKALWVREARTFMFTSFPYDEELVLLIDRVPFGATYRTERIGG